MALTKPLNIETAKKKPAPSPAGSWKGRMPGHISAEDAEKEPRGQRLFP